MRLIFFICLLFMMGCKTTGTLYFTVNAYSPGDTKSVYFLRSGNQRISLVDTNGKYQFGDTFKLVKLKKIVYE